MTVPKFENFKDIKIISFWDKTWGYAEELEKEKQKPNPSQSRIKTCEEGIKECLEGDTASPEWVQYLPRKIIISYTGLEIWVEEWPGGPDDGYDLIVDDDYEVELDYEFWDDYFWDTFKEFLYEVTEEEFESIDINELEDYICDKFADDAAENVSESTIDYYREPWYDENYY